MVDRHPQKNRLDNVQVLRAIASVMVVIYHATRIVSDRDPGTALPVWNTGQAGVDIFFVISGLVMALSVDRPGHASWRTFAFRRITRIVPMYWLATSIKLAAVLLAPALLTHASFDWWHVIASYLFIPARNPEGVVYPLLYVGWTLNFEMLFYVLFALALAFRVALLPFLTLSILSLVALGSLRSGDWPAAATLLSPLLLEFLAGVGLGKFASKFMAGEAQLHWGSLLSIAVASALVMLAAPAGTDQSVWRVAWWGLPSVGIVFVAMRARAQPQKIWLDAGNASYVIYLFHGFILSAFGALLSRMADTLPFEISWVVLSVLASCILGVWINRYLEDPLTKRLNASTPKLAPAVTHPS